MQYIPELLASDFHNKTETMTASIHRRVQRFNIIVAYSVLTLSRSPSDAGNMNVPDDTFVVW